MSRNEQKRQGQTYLSGLFFGAAGSGDHGSRLASVMAGGALCFLLVSLVAFVAHPFHTSLTQIQYDAKNQAFEVSFRVFTDDLETALTKENNGNKIHLQDQKHDRLIEKYIRKQFIIADAQRKPKVLTYIGYEPEGDAQWIYFELPGQSPDGLKNVVIKHTLLMDLFDDQVNLVNLQSSQQKKTIVFRNNQPVQAVSL
ncbi:DUF6702 family protein [Fibrella aestuarina]|nr:DUF6702 family protein [Fibrella aestuarina]